ncbi:MAG TPA: hypothetical protein VLW17_13675 [Thermoanaerobaculaceae bacterium]|nr:hypothetical protein [Thermoanaerobaculaceae bacterium]
MAEPKPNDPAPDGARQAAAKPAGDGGAAPPRGRKVREDQRAEIVAELHALRATLDEVVAQFRVRAGGQLAEVERGVQGSSPNGAKVARPTARARAEMLRQVRLLRVKPRKGRVKDIVRLAELIEELVELLPGGR